MSGAFIAANTLDDLLRHVVTHVQNDGVDIGPSRGAAREISGVLLELTEPRARLSRTETRGVAFSCLGEFCWYLSGDDTIAFMEYYVPRYAEYSTVVDGVVFGAYGPRLLHWDEHNQLDEVVGRLKRSPASRKAVLQFFDRSDLWTDHEDVPCTLTAQFLVREHRLNLLVSMRSNDVVKGLPHDVFCFTMIQELVARALGVDLGWYRHAVGSLHIYDDDASAVEDFLHEGWQSSLSPMPPMPDGPQWSALDAFLEAEARVRLGVDAVDPVFREMDPYWADLARMLLALRASRAGENTQLEKLRKCMASATYHTFIDARLKKLG